MPEFGDYRIAPMAPEDIPCIRRIEKQSFDECWQEGSFEKELANTNTACYLTLKESGVLVAYMGSWLILEEAHITTFAVDPSRRRENIGTLLMLRFMEEIIGRGIHWATLEVHEKNGAAIALYTKFGFKKIGTRKKYYNETDDGHVMWVGNLHRLPYRETLTQIKNSLPALRREERTS